MMRKIIALLIIVCVSFEQIVFAQTVTRTDIPAFTGGNPVNGAATGKFRPMHLRSLSYDSPSNDIKVLIDKGDAKDAAAQAGSSGRMLMEYFFTGLVLPESALWVNLRPDAPGDMIDRDMEKTDLGKVLLAADVQLKRDCAAFTSPNTPEGRVYWEKLYKKAEEIYGSSTVSIPTLTRPWIVPGEIIVSESGETAHIYKATLQVLLEQDYLKGSPTYAFGDGRQKELNEYASELMRELVVPRLNREINSGKRYADFRQAYYSLILAQWFKRSGAVSLSRYVSRIDSRDLSGLYSKTPWNKNEYFSAYQKSFKEGEYNITGREAGKNSARTYFAGGIRLGREIWGAVEAGLIHSGRMGEMPGYAEYCIAASVSKDGEIVLRDGGLEADNEMAEKNRQAAVNRQKELASALAKVNLSDKSVNIYVINAAGFGLMGSAAIVANGLAAAGVRVNVYIEETQYKTFSHVFENGVMPDLVTLFPLSRQGLTRELVAPAAAHVSVGWGNMDFLGEDAGEYVIDSFTNMRDKLEKLRRGRNIGGGNDLRDPEGTMFFDRGMTERKSRKDGWARDELIRARTEMLSRLLGERKRETLYSFGQARGWDPAKAIWSFGYIQEQHEFLAEMENLTAMLASGMSMPFINEGEQVIINLVPGEIVRRNDMKSYRLAQRLLKLGVNVMFTDGDMLEGEPDKARTRVPVTVILHERIDNSRVKDLLSGLNGTLVRDPTDSFYIDFPAYITGSASWLEAMSAGCVYLHDNYDMIPGLQEDNLLDALRKQIAFEDVAGTKSWERVKSEAAEMINDFIIGQPGHERLYGDLAGWTRRARDHARALMKFDMVDDIIVKISRDGGQKKNNEMGGEIRRMARKRHADLAAALAGGNYRDKTVNMYVVNAAGYGLMGSSVTVANDLASFGVNVNLYIDETQYDFLSDRFKGSVEDGPVTILPMPEGLARDTIKPASAQVLVGWRNSGYLDGKSGMFLIDSSSELYGKLARREKNVLGGNDLGSPEGALFFDRRLAERRARRDAMTLNEMIRKREELLFRLLGERKRQDLYSFARAGGWHPAKSIWSFGYIQTSSVFLNEIERIAGIFNSGSSFPFIPEGEQLVVNLVAGDIVHHWENGSRGLGEELLKLGINVMFPDGDIREGKPDGNRVKAPITVVIHDWIDNALVKTLLAEMNGTLARDSTDSFWIDFPVFITGTASWLEAISAECIYLHDNYDMQPGNQEFILELALRRQLALEDQAGIRGWESIEAEARISVGDYLMGRPGHERLYRDLEMWSRRARTHSRALRKFNMVDDIIVSISGESPGGDAQVRKDGGLFDRRWQGWLEQHPGRYTEGILEALKQGRIVFSSTLQESFSDSFSHFRYLSDTNTRSLMPPAAKIFTFQLLNAQGSMRAIDIGGGTGRGCGDMKRIADAMSVNAAIHYNGRAPINPVMALTKNISDVESLLMGKMLFLRGQVYYYREDTPDGIGLAELVDLQEKGAGIFEERTSSPFVDMQFIGDFLSMDFPGRYDFILDQFGGIYYSDQQSAVEKACSLLSENGVFYYARVSYFEECEQGLPEDAAAIEFMEQKSMLAMKRTSPLFKKVFPYLTRSGFVKPGLPGVYEMDTIDDLLAVLESNDPEDMGGRDGGTTGKTPANRGGIDLRGMPTGVIAADLEGMNQDGVYPVLTFAQIEKEWTRIEKLSAAGMSPAAARIGHFVGCCEVRGVLDRYTENLLALIAGVLRDEESDFSPADPVLRSVLARLSE